MRIVPRLAILAVVLALSVVAVSPAAAASLPALPPPPGTILGVHTVKSGETLDCIGRAYSVDPNAIAQANYVTTIVTGQQLSIPAVPWYNIPAGTTCPAQFQVPAGWPPPPPTTIFGQHTVLQGEWIYCIARAYRVNPMAIAQASGIPGPYGPIGWYGGYYPYYSPWNYVLPGQVLKIPAVPWYNIPAGPTCAPQSTVTLPAGW